MRSLLVPVVALFTSVAVACGSSSSGNAGPSDAGGVEASTDDAGADTGPSGPAPFPAVTPFMPAVAYHKGTVLKTPKIVTITWDGDTNSEAFESFGDQIGASDYWKATTSEYGVGAATSGVHYRITTPPPATITDTDFAKYVSMQAGGAPANGWPVADENTIYMFYLSPMTTLMSQGADACGYFDGYHDETFTNTLPHVVYGVAIQKCLVGQNAIQDATTTASHELIEASTDPHTQSDTAYVGLDQDHYAWTLWLADQTEIGDMCEAFDQEVYRDPFGYTVQRTWSNAGAIAGHDPCVPRPTTPYFNVSPLDLEDIVIKPIKGSAAGTKAKGYTIPVGTTKQIQLGFYSDAPFDAWEVSVIEGDAFDPAQQAQTTLILDKKAGGNGDTATLSVTVNKLNGPDSGIILTAASQAPGTAVHYMPILISGK